MEGAPPKKRPFRDPTEAFFEDSTMCTTASGVRGLSRWNWDGDVIIHDCIVRSARKAVGSELRYDIDVREFLTSERNEVVRRTLVRDIPEYLKIHPFWGTLNPFVSREVGSFDLRANIVAAYVSDAIGYKDPANRDPWQFPDETLRLQKGDCEDRAFLLASLLIAGGISAYNVRLALGTVHLRSGSELRGKYDHMWVMYKAESGAWLLIEPSHLPKKRSAKSSRPTGAGKAEPAITAEYIPYFLFNDAHLWAVRHRDSRSVKEMLNFRRKWSHFNPAFAGEVHQTILNKALYDADPHVLAALNRHFSRAVAGVIGPIVDDVDRGPYDPCDHFDNGYIFKNGDVTGGWDEVRRRLEKYREDKALHLEQFALAAHGIADFYSHSSYAHFARTEGEGENEVLLPCNPADPASTLREPPTYASDTSFDLSRFSTNRKWTGTPEERAERWDGQIISGRYAQDGDTQPGLINGVTEGFTYIPSKYLNQPDFSDRYSLPHHNEIAVDQKTPGSQHALYRGTEYTRQFRLRKRAAISHIRTEFTRP